MNMIIYSLKEINVAAMECLIWSPRGSGPVVHNLSLIHPLF